MKVDDKVYFGHHNSTWVTRSGKSKPWPPLWCQAAQTQALWSAWAIVLEVEKSFIPRILGDRSWQTRDGENNVVGEKERIATVILTGRIW